MKLLDYNLRSRWLVGLDTDDAVWDATVFAENRERPLAGDIAQGQLAELSCLGHVQMANRSGLATGRETPGGS